MLVLVLYMYTAVDSVALEKAATFEENVDVNSECVWVVPRAVRSTSTVHVHFLLWQGPFK